MAEMLANELAGWIWPGGSVKVAGSLHVCLSRRV